MNARITVVLPLYNAGGFLHSAIESVLNQTLSDFRLLIMDDHSTDDSVDIASQYKDTRMEIIRANDEKGLIPRLNQALQLVESEYIARMDADDIAHPNRFQQQAQFLDAHPEIGVIGCAYLPIDSSGTPIGGPQRKAESDDEIRWEQLFGSPFAHPGVMYRRSVVEGNHLRYNPAWSSCEDYDFWRQFLLVSQGANLPEVLLQYRVYPGQVSQARRAEQHSNHIKISIHSISCFLGGLTIAEQAWEEVLAWINPAKDWQHGEGAWKNRAAITQSQVYVEFVKRYGWNRHLHPARQLAKSVRRLMRAPQPGWGSTLAGISPLYIQAWMKMGKKSA